MTIGAALCFPIDGFVVSSCMHFSRAYHMAGFDITSAEGSDSVCYVLLPDGALADLSRWAEKASPRFNTNVVLITGMDWNRDMSPWPADGVMKDKKNFPGGAAMYVKELCDDFIPTVEQWLKLKSPKRYLIGVSLSGLFSIWTLSKTSLFVGVGSVSGSLWYDGLVEWTRKTPLLSNAKLYLSLGAKEKNTSDRRMATVEGATNEMVALLREKGFDVTFEIVPGTHFSPVAPKFDRALEILMTESSDSVHQEE